MCIPKTMSQSQDNTDWQSRLFIPGDPNQQVITEGLPPKNIFNLHHRKPLYIPKKRSTADYPNFNII